MGTIKFWYFMCLVLFGKMNQEQVEKLVEMFNSYELYCDRTPKWNLSGFRRGSFPKSYLSRVLRFWFGSYVPNKSLFGKVMENKATTILYLESVGKRTLAWENYEQKAILKLSSTRIGYLTKQLSSKYEEKLLDDGSKTQKDAYLQKFALSLAAERRFIGILSQNSVQNGIGQELHAMACRYVEAHPNKAFSKMDSQQLLFELPNCEDVQEALIKQSTMLKPSLRDVAIEELIDNAAKRHENSGVARLLKEFLSLTCIENEALVEKFQHARLDIHTNAMLTISQMRQNVLNTLSQYGFGLFGLYDEPYLYPKEKEIMAMQNDDERRNLVMEKIVPELEKGLVTPACAAWIAWQYPKLAQTAQNGINQFMRRIIDNIHQSDMFSRMRTNDTLF